MLCILLFSFVFIVGRAGVLGVALNGLTNYGAFFLLALVQILGLLGTTLDRTHHRTRHRTHHRTR